MKKSIAIILVALVTLTIFVACGHKHEFGDWTVIKEASCTAEGTQERECECGEKETETIPMAEHNYDVKEITKVTCDADGEVEKTCKDCGKAVTETVVSKGHEFNPATVFAPKACKNCGITEGDALSKALKVGDTAEVEGKHSFTVESVTFTGSLSDKRGYITYNHSSDYACAIKLKFTNLAPENFERWSNNRVSDIKLQYQGKYDYEGEFWCPADDIVPLGSDTIYVVYEVAPALGQDKESAIYTTFTVDDTVYSFIVQEGKAASDDAASEESAADANTEAAIKVGDVRSDGKNFEFTVKDVYFTSKLSEKNGNITHNYSDGFYLAVKLDFKNLSAEAFEEWNSSRISDVSLQFDGQYNYEGKYWCPGDDIVPLSNGNVYVIYEVAEALQSSDAPLTATFKIDGTEFTVDCRNAK